MFFFHMCAYSCFSLFSGMKIRKGIEIDSVCTRTQTARRFFMDGNDD